MKNFMFKSLAILAAIVPCALMANGENVPLLSHYSRMVQPNMTSEQKMRTMYLSLCKDSSELTLEQMLGRVVAEIKAQMTTFDSLEKAFEAVDATQTVIFGIQIINMVVQQNPQNNPMGYLPIFFQTVEQQINVAKAQTLGMMSIYKEVLWSSLEGRTDDEIFKQLNDPKSQLTQLFSSPEIGTKILKLQSKQSFSKKDIQEYQGKFKSIDEFVTVAKTFLYFATISQATKDIDTLNGYLKDYVFDEESENNIKSRLEELKLESDNCNLTTNLNLLFLTHIMVACKSGLGYNYSAAGELIANVSKIIQEVSMPSESVRVNLSLKKDQV